MAARTVLLPSGSEFLVCKIEDDESGVKHVYIRNVQLGLSKTSTVLWVDENLRKGDY